MILYIELKHDSPADRHIRPESLIAYFGQGDSRREIFLDWDESDHSYEDNHTSSRCKGIYIDNDYANGRIHELENIAQFELNLDSDDDAEIRPAIITRLEFADASDRLIYKHIESDGTVSQS